MTGRPLAPLGDLIHVKHGFAFKSQHFSTSRTEIVLTPGHFRIGGGLQLRGQREKYYTGVYPPEFKLRSGDLLVVMTDLTQQAPILGSPAVVPSDRSYLHNQRLGLVTIKRPDLLDLRYLYWLLASDETRAQLRATATGATVRHTAPERIYKVVVPLPEMLVQRQIAEILDVMNDLIDNNRRRIALLEEMAQAIYRQWFEHFRYPGHEADELVGSSLGPIPAGWQVEELVDLATIVMGQSPSSEHYNDSGEGLPFHQGVSNFGSNYPKHVLYCRIEGRLAEAGDHLLSVRAPVGRLNRSDQRVVIGRGLASIRSKRGLQSLLGQQLRAVFHDEDLMGGGTIFKAITKRDLERLPIVQPAADTSGLGEAALEPIDCLIRDLTLATRALERLRNLLLPRLVTGVIDVSRLDLDALLEESAA
jgi:type I restriction enzyme S subunit